MARILVVDDEVEIADAVVALALVLVGASFIAPIHGKKVVVAIALSALAWLVGWNAINPDQRDESLRESVLDLICDGRYADPRTGIGANAAIDAAHRALERTCAEHR